MAVGSCSPPFLVFIMLNEGARIVTSTILGMDFKSVTIAGKLYTIAPPTMKKIAGAGYWLSGMEGDTIKDVIMSGENINAFVHALSWFIQGDDSLFDELSQGDEKEIKKALSEAYSLLSVEDFIGLSGLARNVVSLIAKPKL